MSRLARRFAVVAVVSAVGLGLAACADSRAVQDRAAQAAAVQAQADADAQAQVEAACVAAEAQAHARAAADAEAARRTAVAQAQAAAEAVADRVAAEAAAAEAARVAQAEAAAEAQAAAQAAAEEQAQTEAVTADADQGWSDERGRVSPETAERAQGAGIAPGENVPGYLRCGTICGEEPTSGELQQQWMEEQGLVNADGSLVSENPPGWSPID